MSTPSLFSSSRVQQKRPGGQHSDPVSFSPFSPSSFIIRLVSVLNECKEENTLPRGFKKNKSYFIYHLLKAKVRAMQTSGSALCGAQVEPDQEASEGESAMKYRYL